jgi:hypothetical protein
VYRSTRESESTHRQLIWLRAAIAEKIKDATTPPILDNLSPITTRAKMTHHRKIDLSMFRDDDEDDLVIAPKAKVHPFPAIVQISN